LTSHISYHKKEKKQDTKSQVLTTPNSNRTQNTLLLNKMKHRKLKPIIVREFDC